MCKHALTVSLSAQNHWRIDLSKILGGQTKIFGGQKVVKSDMDISQLLGARTQAVPKSTPMPKMVF